MKNRVVDITGIKDPTFLRLAIAHYMDSTTGKCCYCNHIFQDGDDVIARNPILIEKGKTNTIACKLCLDKNDVGIDKSFDAVTRSTEG